MSAQYLIAEIPIGDEGFEGKNNQSKISRGALINANNLTFENGVLQKEGGAAQYSSATSPPLATTVAIVGGFDWYPSGTTQRPIILTASGTYLKDDGSGAYSTATLATSLTITGPPTFVEGGIESAGRSRKLFLFAAGQKPRVLAGDGSTASELGTPPSDWLTSGTGQAPTFGLAHKNRIWGGGNPNFPHALYYSTASDHEDFTSAGSGTINVYPGDGEKMVGAISFRGQIVAFKRPRGVYLIDTRDATASTWSVLKHNSNIGLAGPRSLTQVDLPDHDDILFMDQFGTFRLLSEVFQETKGTRDISTPRGIDEWMRSNMNYAYADEARMTYYAVKREVHVSIVAGTATSLNRRVVIDMNRPDMVRFRISDRDTVIGDTWLQKDSNGIERLTMGDETGRVWTLDQTSRTKGGAYTAVAQTPHHDMGHVDPSLPTMRKRFKFLELEFIEAGNHDLYADIYIDERFSETVTFNMGDLGDSFTYTFPMVFRGDGTIRRVRRRIRGSGHRVSIQFRNDGDDEDFKVGRIFVGFATSSLRLQAN